MNGFKISAISFLLWGIVHIAGGFMLLSAALDGSGPFLTALTGTHLVMEYEPSAMVFAFHAFNIAWFGLLSSILAVYMLRTGHGYWINLAIVAFADLGLVLFMLIPGLIPLSQGWLGPTLMLIAIIAWTMRRVIPQKTIAV